jgi:hypothetical protein
MTMTSAPPTVPLSSIVEEGIPVFDRSSTVIVGPIQIQNVGSTQGLDVSFRIKRGLKAKERNTCDLKIWNLSQNSLAQLASSAQATGSTYSPPKGYPNVAGKPVTVIPVQIDAGYVGHTSTLFLGELASAQTVTSGADFVTELNSGDSQTGLVLQRINVNVQPGTSPVTVAKQLMSQMGFAGLGNFAAVQSLFTSAPGASSLYQRGGILKGNAAFRLQSLCASVGVEFSIQNGQPQFLALGQPLAGEAYLLSPTTGLVGTPTCDNAGIMNCTAFLVPGLVPGAPINVQSAFVNGLFRILSVEYVGETNGQPWYAKLQAGSLGVAP